MIVLVLGALGASLLVWYLTVPLRRRVRRSAAADTIEFEGKQVRVDVATWAVAAVVGANRVVDQLLAANPKTPDDAAIALQATTSTLSAADRAQMVERLNMAERARAERALWAVQVDSISAAAGAGMLDALIIAAGEHTDWAIAFVEHALENVDVSTLVIEHVLNNRYDHYWGMFHHLLFEQTTAGIDHLAGHAIDAGVSAGLEGAGHAFTAIADAHLPVVTIFRAVHQAAKSQRAGLESGRVRENLLLDVGLKGGAVASGAAIGTAVLPFVGTIVGGVLGGLLGGGAAKTAKERHLRAAMRQAAEQSKVLGESIARVNWKEVAASLAQHRDWLRCVELQLIQSCGGTRRLVPPLAQFILAAAAAVGAAEVAAVSSEYEDWLGELEELTGGDGATFRGVFVLTRPDLHKPLKLDPALTALAEGAYHLASQERQKLALAH